MSAKPKLLRVVIADDHPTIMFIVKQILSAEPHIEVVGEAVDGQGAVALVESLHPDVAVLNVVMPHMSGFDVARRIHKSVPDTAILILSTHKDAQFVQLARECGAHGYVDKKDAALELVLAVDTVSQGQEFFVA
jgi:DNA-binding NarL/FixJ family response regulator